MVSTTFRLPATDIKSPDFTNLLVGFGQFLSHDNEFTPITRKKSYLQPRESYGKKLKSCKGILLRTGLFNRARPSKPFLPKMGHALKRTPVQDFDYFSIIFYYMISTSYQKFGDLFCPIIILGFRTV